MFENYRKQLEICKRLSEKDIDEAIAEKVDRYNHFMNMISRICKKWGITEEKLCGMLVDRQYPNLSNITECREYDDFLHEYVFGKRSGK